MTWTTRRALNHSLAEAGRDLWVHLVKPLLKQGHPEQSAQDHVQKLLKIPKEETPQLLWALAFIAAFYSCFSLINLSWKNQCNADSYCRRELGTVIQMFPLEGIALMCILFIWWQEPPLSLNLLFNNTLWHQKCSFRAIGLKEPKVSCQIFFLRLECLMLMNS